MLFRSLRNSKAGLLEKSPLHKIAATIKRVNKSNSFREAAKAGTKVEVTTENKSRPSKSTYGHSTKTTTSLDDFVHQTTPADKRKDDSKSITAFSNHYENVIPILENLNQPDKKKSPLHEIDVPEQLCATMNKKEYKYISCLAHESDKIDISGVGTSRQQSLGEEESITEVTTDSVPHTRTNLSDYVNRTNQNKKQAVDKSVTSLPITSVTSTSYLDQSSFVSLPVLSPSRGIAIAARRSSINMMASIIKYDLLPAKSDHSIPSTDNGIPKPDVIEASNFLEDDLIEVKEDFHEVDMEYGPHNIREIETSQNQKFTKLASSICESSAASDGESLCGTEATPVGIAKAARRSSVQLISMAEYDEVVSISGNTSISDDSTMASWKLNEKERRSTGKDNIRRHPQKSISNLSIPSLDLYRRPHAFQHHGGLEIEDALFESCSSIDVGQSIFLPRRAEVIGILRLNSSMRNVSRHVKFADQQPGGGRRMSFLKSVKNDSSPVRPRRSNNFELDRLRNLRRKQKATDSVEPLNFMSHIAATAIQASVRRWIQWTAMRPLLLTRKLVWIEENRIHEILKIQQEKWSMMENLQSEIVDRERRLEAQVALADKLCDHLKRDSAIVKSQSKTIKEFTNILKFGNNHLDQSIRLNRDNFVTANLTVEFLREKSDTLLATSKKYAARIDKLQAELETTMKRVDIENRSKLKIKKTLNRMFRLLKQRGFDLYEDMVMRSVEPINLDKLSAQEFNVTLHSTENDIVSLCSDITDDSVSSPIDDIGQEMDYDHFEAKLSTRIDEMDRTTRSICKTTAASSDNSFATYDIQIVKRQLSMDSNSLAGNSFASYNAPDLSRKVVTLQSNAHTHAGNTRGPYAAAVPPRRLPSSNSCFSAIREEVSIGEDSLDSDII